MTSKDAMNGLDPRELLREGLAPEEDPAANFDPGEEREVREAIERLLPDLEVHELIGRGGMGYVYRARQRRLDREVALKVLAPRLGEQPDFAERFAREAKAMARLNHPNIVGVFDYGREESLCYLVMELVDGTSLRDVIRNGKLAPAEALAIVPGICEALQYAHNEGVVHRDVKPENILLDREGRVKIADFGLAKLVGTPAPLVTLTGSQQVLGTLRYMAPEQLNRPLEVDHRADIYSLGVVFYEMLTGEVPMGRFDPPSAIAGSHVQLDNIVMRTLASEPDQRYQRVRDVRTDVESAGEHGAATDGAQEPVRRPGPQPIAAGEPRLSALAVVSPILFAIGVLPMVIVFVGLKLLTLRQQSSTPVVINVDSGVETSGSSVPLPGPMELSIVMGLPCILWVGMAVVACILGWNALGRIRRAWPNLYGVGGATVGAWIGPLLLLDLIVLFAVVSFAGSIGVTSTPFLALMTVIVLLSLNGGFMLWYRERFLERCRKQASA